jgi:S-layer homology domain
VLSTNRDFAPARAAAGYTALAQKRASDAVAQFDAATPAGKPYVPALVGRGLALLALTREEEALASFEAALAAYRKAAAIEPSPALEATIARVRERAREAALPSQYRAIPDRTQVTRGDLAALLGVRLTALARAPQRQVVVTDVRGHWAESWIQTVARSGAMEVYSNYTFQPDAPLRRLGLADAVSRALGVLRPAATVAGWDATAVTVTDVPAEHLAYPAVRRAVASGVLRLEGGAFNLLRPVTGAEVVDVVTRLSAMAGARR